MNKENIKICQKCDFVTMFQDSYVNNHEIEPDVEVTCDKTIENHGIGTYRIKEEIDDNYMFYLKEWKRKIPKEFKIEKTFKIPNECPFYLEQILVEKL